MSESELRAIFGDLEKRFKKGALDHTTSFYISLGDGAAEKWTVIVGPEKCEVREGKIEKADCVLKTTSDFFLKMVRDRYTPGFLDFTRGKIKTNDPGKLPDLQKAFGL
jgi:putative sterol carrier protein